MFNKLNPKALLIVFAALIGLVLFFNFQDERSGKRTFKNVLSDIDTSAVTEVLLHPKGHKEEPIHMLREDGQWYLEKDTNTRIKASNATISSALGLLSSLKTQRLAGLDEEKWTGYEVTAEQGTTAEVKVDQETVLNIIIGKFTFQPPKSTFSFVRLVGETETYVVDGMLDPMLNREFDVWRATVIVSIPAEDVRYLQWNTPDTSIELKIEEDKWLLGQVEADSSLVKKLLAKVSRVSADAFDDETSLASLGDASHTLKIKSGSREVLISAWNQDLEKGPILHSSLHKESLFLSGSGDIFKTFFLDPLEQFSAVKN